ncbi:hypothetical protein B296_00001211 [Ensete ventricosum]|uniref:Uncharacterized protein n=1 Tax=Ensete ventricosum TaxID=4639 RepID=A0A427AB28_ENSVE|nr:hypothetical protein B296_00001211 [Ensete ventricosum]
MSSIHLRLGEVKGGRQSIAGSEHNSLYHFWQRFTYPTNTRVQKDMSNKNGIYRKHMRNNKMYMC